MSRDVYVYGFDCIERARSFAENFQKYHNEKHHVEGRELFMKETEGHLVNVLGECERGQTVSIPLYSSEPRSHGYETAIDVITVIRMIDPDLRYLSDYLEIKVPA